MESSEYCGSVSGWNIVEVFQETSSRIGFFNRLKGWETD